MIEILIILLFTAMLFSASFTQITLMLMLCLVVLINLYLVIKGKIKIKLNKTESLILILFSLANLKNFLLFMFSDLSVFSLLYSLGELYLFYLMILLAKNRDTHKLQRIFKYSFVVGFLISTYVIITNDLIIAVNAPIVLMLPYAMSNKVPNKYIKVFVAVLFIAYALILESRGELIAYIYFVVITLFPPKARNAVFKLSFVAVLILFLYVINNYMDLWLNDLLTNRPLIWKYYLDDILSSVQNMLIGQGRMSDDVSGGAASAVGDFLQRGVGLQYSPHSFYLYYLYEHGFIFTLILVGLLIRHLKKSAMFKPEIMSFLIVGFASPIKIGGFGILSLFFTLYLAFFLTDSDSTK